MPASARQRAARPWDFGPYPRSWAEIVDRDYDELWVFTTWGRDCAVARRRTPERVRRVPLGVDTQVFQPEGPTHEMTHDAAKTFLFVGATTDRKGIDILLRAFVAAFDRAQRRAARREGSHRRRVYTGLSQRDAVLEASAPARRTADSIRRRLPRPVRARVALPRGDRAGPSVAGRGLGAAGAGSHGVWHAGGGPVVRRVPRLLHE